MHVVNPVNTCGVSCHAVVSYYKMTCSVGRSQKNKQKKQPRKSPLTLDGFEYMRKREGAVNKYVVITQTPGMSFHNQSLRTALQ